MLFRYCIQRTLHLLLWLVCVCVQGEEKVCALQCRCEGSEMTCADGIPVSVPQGVTTLRLGGLDLDNDTFEKDPAYSGITRLTIFATAGRAISENYFHSFANLEYLGIHGDQLRTIDISSFIGLENLHTLNISINPYLNIFYISEAINCENRKILPKLETLSVAYISTLLTTPIDLNEYFYRSFTTGRKVKYLDISGLNIDKIDFRVLYKYACDSIETLIAANAVISHIVIDFFVSFVTCSSLKKLDISGIEIPATRTKFSFKIFNFHCDALSFFSNVEYLNLGNINTHEYLVIDGYNLTMEPCPLKCRKVMFWKNIIKLVNMTVTLHEITRESFEELDVSFNLIEYISPDVLRPSVNIKTLDFSHNKLGPMEINYKRDFENLFSAQCKLETLNISNNGLVNIPEYTFRNNTMLRYLDISFNLIETLSFYVKHLIHLEELIAVNNRMKTISFDFRSNTQWLFVKMMNIRNVSLHGNSFPCTCTKESKAIIEWLFSERFIDNSMPLFCELDGRKVNILTTAVGDTKQYCTLQKLKTIAAFVGPSLVVVLTIMLAVSVLLVRKRRRERAFKSVISRIKNGDFPKKYLTFLSYSSDDATPVMTHLYPKLSAVLSEIVHSQKEHICVGDKHFRPGFSLRCELIRCISESSVFIGVISEEFCKKPWCNEEFKEAYDQNKPIILIMLDHVDQNSMHPFLKKIFNKNAHASWISDEDGGHLEPDWYVFCKSVIELAGTNE